MTDTMSHRSGLPGHRFRASVKRTRNGRWVLTIVAPDASSAAAAEFDSQGEALDAIPSLLREMTGDLPPMRGEAVDGPHGRFGGAA